MNWIYGTGTHDIGLNIQDHIEYDTAINGIQEQLFA